MAETPLDLLERLIANGDAETIVECSDRRRALERAQVLLAIDPSAAADFGTPGALANHLHGLASPNARYARAALAETARIDAAKVPLSLSLLVDGLRSQDAKIRQLAFAFVDTPQKLASTAEFLLASDSDARTQFAGVHELAAFLRAGAPRPAPAVAARSPAAVAARTAPVSVADDDMTDAEIQRWLGFPRGHGYGLEGALAQKHIRPHTENGVYGYFPSSLHCIGDRPLQARIAAALNQRLAAEAAEERDRAARLDRLREARRVLEETI